MSRNIKRTFQSTVGRVVRCGRLLRRESVHRGCRTVRRSKCLGESFIVESLSVELFINIAYVAECQTRVKFDIEVFSKLLDTLYLSITKRHIKNRSNQARKKQNRKFCENMEDAIATASATIEAATASSS
ncbi:hypothetical protein YC2023_079206 [Brassica napus]